MGDPYREAVKPEERTPKERLLIELADMMAYLALYPPGPGRGLGLAEALMLYVITTEQRFDALEAEVKSLRTKVDPPPDPWRDSM